MNNIGELIKELAIGAVEQEKPVSVVTGRIKENNRLIVETEQKMVIDESFFIVPYRFKNRIWLKGEEVVMLRCDGGQRYLIVDML